MMKIIIVALIATLTSVNFVDMMTFGRVRDTNRERCPRVIMLIQFELYSEPPPNHIC